MLTAYANATTIRTVHAADDRDVTVIDHGDAAMSIVVIDTDAATRSKVYRIVHEDISLRDALLLCLQAEFEVSKAVELADALSSAEVKPSRVAVPLA